MSTMLRRSGTLRADGESSSSKGLGIILVLLALMLTVGVGAYLYLYTNVFDELFGQKDEVATTVTPTEVPNPTESLSPAPTSMPEETPTPAPTEAPNTYSIQVLNGNGVAGSAGKAQAVLESAGYKVVSSANATRFDYETTLIQSKSNVSSTFIDALKATLSSSYTITIGSELSADNETDIILIVGQK